MSKRYRILARGNYYKVETKFRWFPLFWYEIDNPAYYGNGNLFATIEEAANFIEGHKNNFVVKVM